MRHMILSIFFGLPTAVIAAVLLALAAVVVVNALFASLEQDGEPVAVEARMRR